MFSFSNHLSLNNPSMFHSYVDSFFEGKKALVKERLMDSVKVVVDGLFEEMVGQVKEMLLPPKTDNDQVKAIAASTPTPEKPSTSKPPMKSVPPKSTMVFVTKSKPGPSTSTAQPFSGLFKRMAEEDGGGIINSNKKKAVVVNDKSTDGDVAISTSDEEPLVVIPIEQALQENGLSFSFISADGGGGGEQQQQVNSNSNVNVINKEQQQIGLLGKHPCTEPNCGKHFPSKSSLKTHLRTHSNAKPFGCTFPGCSLEFSQRANAVRHILNVHLKKQKPGDGEEEGGEPPNPATYLSVKEELL